MVPHSRTGGSFRERQIASSAQGSGDYTDGAQVSRKGNGRVGAGELNNKRVPSRFPPTSPFSGDRLDSLQLLVVWSQGLCAEASASWLLQWFVVWQRPRQRPEVWPLVWSLWSKQTYLASSHWWPESPSSLPSPTSPSSSSPFPNLSLFHHSDRTSVSIYVSFLCVDTH